ncbi:hypothetical protein GCM10012290_25720 [Halolactibacillus alkaliphilus]|uniref:Uncharacterized protein n=1 Tax=Halolactibacillus alkaliphilus TaxID=442899 RepID=A0A511X546_9BACI|nr:zinc-ribbon domain-containing protein [Halolactibacillus alkaliphilus]GEN58087.1 hypothetical protein HAL01_25510 [Halolactibacillus alkaliphilus]GGN76218.1 hypothetical protein GCM10012290_25720 [Halolactibacillus alkaliphilus]SFP13591.1 Uncharacterized membrane protein YvbJ [Halolactibacillus alkaliphilus]
MYCKNCGTKNDSDKKFCKSCGTPLTTHVVKETPLTSEQAVVQKHQPNNATQQKSKPKKPMATSTKLLLILGIVLLFVLIGTYKWAENYYSFEAQRDRLMDVIKTLDAKAYSEVIESNHPAFEVTEASVQPFVEYLSTRPEAYNDMLRFLMRDKDSFNYYDQLYIRQQGKHLGLFDKYILVITPVEFYVMTNVEKIDVTYEGSEDKLTMQDASTAHVGPVAPGIHHVVVETTLAGEEVLLEHSEAILFADESGYIPEMYVDFETFEFYIYSDVDTATVLVNESPIGDLVDGEGFFGPVLWQEDLVMTFSTVLDTGEEVEKEVQLDPNRYEYNIQVYPSVSSYDIEQTIGQVYRAASVLADEESDEQLDTLASYLVDGRDNDLFNTYKNTGKRYRDNDDISSVYYRVYLQEYDVIDLTTVRVTYELSVNEYGSAGDYFELMFTGDMKILDDGMYAIESVSLVD